MPAKQEGCIAAEGDGADECIPSGVEEELYERDDLEEQGQEEGCSCFDFGEDGEGSVSNETAGYAC
jgi:hypothetical protein